MDRTISATRRILSIAMVFTLLAGVLAFNAEDVSAASKLKVTPSSKTLYVGKTATFKANKNVKWSVVKGKSNIKVVSKNNKTLKIKGLKKGTSYVKAKSGSSYKKIKIVVKTPVAPKKITLKADKTRLIIGEECNVSVKSVSPSAASTDVVYSSSNAEIATVRSNGKVRGMKSGRVDIIATSALDNKVSGSVTICVDANKSGSVTVNIDLSEKDSQGNPLYPQGKKAKVWVPVPRSNTDWNTEISNLQYKADNASKSYRRNDSAGNKIWYIEWDENVAPEDRVARMEFELKIKSTVCDDNLASKENGSVDASAFEEYLEETAMSGSITSGIVKETADKIVQDANAETVYDKAYAIYSWITENLYKDDTSKNVGTGDVLSILDTGTAAGCQDINAVFTAFCNAVGIPAREVFGLKLTNSNDIPSAKCHAEFYLPGYGWVPCDAYDALKAIMGDEELYRGENAERSGKWKQIKAKYWAYREEGWLAVATGRDITLNPDVDADTDERQIRYKDTRKIFTLKDGKINIFMNPYGEYDGKPLSVIQSEAQQTQDKEDEANGTKRDSLKNFYNYGKFVDDFSCGC